MFRNGWRHTRENHTPRGIKFFCASAQSFVRSTPYATVLYAAHSFVSALASVIEYISLMQSNLLFNTNNWSFGVKKKKQETRAPVQNRQNGSIAFSNTHSHSCIVSLVVSEILFQPVLLFFSVWIVLSLIYALPSIKIRSQFEHSSRNNHISWAKSA